ncbi:MAG: YraN family protein [Ignavibacteria bacterium]|nr:YraN family protein [Ignavibacteria bacterium]MBT8381381.1 YraN family protein [Ignavibacteria bacterium]MBT8391358.1 YraN family protein [Ignavibacteria bacterium]NNJ53028.1 YraN family protein [Ignavibacteriaceae bacterium]NNL21457.1 YraN family protein [Ignavibacteriaceae bacterium]
MALSKKDLAAKGEELAAAILADKGYEIIEQNYRYGHGEIDIIAIDRDSNCTVFVEVKSRKNLEYGEPEYSITKSKQTQIRKVAELYLFDKEIKELDCRFDVVTILFEDLSNPKVNHYENAF